MAQKTLNLYNKFKYAIRGIYRGFHREPSLRTQIFIGIGMIIFCVFDKTPPIWTAVFLTLVALVISLEMVNTAVEALLDKLHPEQDETIGFVKDCLAGAVLIASIFAVVVFDIYIYLKFSMVLN